MMENVVAMFIHPIDIETLLFRLEESCSKSFHIISCGKLEEDAGRGRVSRAFVGRTRHG
jgi:hypothetical protein